MVDPHNMDLIIRTYQMFEYSEYYTQLKNSEQILLKLTIIAY